MYFMPNPIDSLYGYITMPLEIVPLPDVYETVIREVAVDAVRQIALNMQLPSATRVYLPGVTDVVPMNDGQFGNCCDGHSDVHFDPEERITVTYEELADENYSLSTSVYNNDNFPIFINQPQQINIYPITRLVDFRIDIQYQAPNIVIAQRWLDDQRTKYSSGAAELTLALTYHYNLPTPVISLLKGLYDTQQRSPLPSKLDFDKWLCQYWTGPTTDMSTLIGTHPVLSIYQREVDVVGWFDFYNTPDTPTPTSDGSGAFEVTFSFLCRYARPTHLKIEYPLLMNNVVIPKVFMPEHFYQNYQAAFRKTTGLRGSLEWSDSVIDKSRIPYIQHPDVDNWQPRFTEELNLTFFTGLIVVCNDNPTNLMSVLSLGRYTFSPYWLEYLSLVGDKVFGKGGLLEARLYRNDLQVPVKIHFDKASMSLKTTTPLDLTGYYHIQLSFKTNFAFVEPPQWEIIRRFPKVFCEFAELLKDRKPGRCEVIGVGRPRPEDGEGSTQYTEDLEYTVPEGYIRKSAVLELIKEQSNIDYKNDSIRTILNLGIITTKRES